MLVRMRSMPPTDSMDMAGKSSTAVSGDTGVSGNRGYQSGPPRGWELPGHRVSPGVEKAMSRVPPV